MRVRRPRVTQSVAVPRQVSPLILFLVRPLPRHVSEGGRHGERRTEASDGLTARTLAESTCSFDAFSSHLRAATSPSTMTDGRPLGVRSDPTYHTSAALPSQRGRDSLKVPARQYHSDRFIPTLNDQGASLPFGCSRTHCCLFPALLRGAYPTFEPRVEVMEW
jgi:hypothetical protein